MSAENNEQILREILKWIKFAGMKGVKEQLETALDSDQKKLVYQLSDGSKGIVEIGKIARIASTSTISRYWKSWSKMGLGEYLAVRGGDRFKRSFDLQEVGIELPEAEENKQDEKSKEGKQDIEKTQASV